MAKTTIINLDSLIDVKVTENVNVIAANAASATATAKAGEAATSADVAELHKIAAADSVMAAGANAGIATTKASEASASAGVSTIQAGIATVQAGLAIDAKNNTDALYAAALDVLTQTNKIYDDFDDRWLGGHSSNPTVDNDGFAILDGALYWNTTTKSVKVYSQTSLSWTNVKDADGSLLIINNLADVNDNAEARTNIDVYSKAETVIEVGTQIELQKGAANGIAELDVNGLVPSSQLPSYVDDVIEVATYATLPVTGESGKIYVVVADETSNGDTSSYRWTGTIYAMVSNTLTATDIKSLYESNLDTNAYTDAEQAKVGYITVTQAVDLDTIESDTSLNNTHRTSNGTDHTYINQDVTTTATPTFAGIITTGLVDGRDISVDGLKLDGIEAGATADQTASEIEVLYEGIADTNKYTDAEKTKLSNTEITTQLNDRDTANRDRANHTGTQSIDTVTETAGLKVMTSTERTVLDAATPLTTTATTLTTAINELDSGKVNTTDVISVTNGGTGATDAAGARTNLDVPQATEINAVLGTAVNKRYDKRLAALDIIDMEYTSGDLVTVRYTGDNDTSVFYRDVLAYVTGDLVTVKHYCNTADLVTESGLTTLVYDIDKNLISSSYTEV